jgi:phosphatidylserine/phosphatidylglycerophosphate/cardiolipin synthase-like enzyme
VFPLSLGLMTVPPIFFSPNGGATKAVVTAIENSKAEIRIAMYAFTKREIREALIAAKHRGVDVQVILDRKQASHKESVWRWKGWQEAGIPTRFSVTKWRACMHHKFGVIDRRAVITGSFGWTGNGEGFNRENMLLMENEALAATYLKQFVEIPANDEPPKDKEKSVAGVSQVEEEAGE